MKESRGDKVCFFPLFSDPFDVVRESPAAFGKSSGGSCLTIQKTVLNDVYLTFQLTLKKAPKSRMIKKCTALLLIQ